MPTVSLCMCVKNEGRTLERAITSVLGAVDEIVIGVDNSSDDGTLDIARKYGSAGKVFKFQWQDSFSYARNEVIKRADGDLILILDGHEFVPSDNDPISLQLSRMRHIDTDKFKVMTPLSILEQIRQQGIPPEFDVICLTLGMNPDEWGIPGLFFLQPRIFRNNGSIKYASEVHNYLTGYSSEKTMGCPEGVIIHAMPPEREEQRKAQRRKMNVQGLSADVKREYAKPRAERDGRPFFYLGNTYSDLGVMDKAVYWYKQYLLYSKFGEEKYQVLQQLAVITYRHYKDYALARKYVLESMQIQWRRSEPLVMMGEIALTEEHWDEAFHWYDLARTIPAPPSVMFMQGTLYSFLVDVKRALCMEKLGRIDEAMRYLEAAHTWHPGDANIVNQMAVYRKKLKEGSPEYKPNLLIVDAIGSFTEDIAISMKRFYEVVVAPAMDEKWKAWADVVWFEWCDQNIVQWSHTDWNIPTVCRLHSYEAFSDMPASVEWKNVRHLVFVAEHIRELFFRKWPQLQNSIETSVIPNGVDISKWTYRKREHGKKIACVGYLNPKKGTELLLLLAHSFPDYEFHVCGQFQDAHIHYDFINQVSEMPNVWYTPGVQHGQMDEWLDDKDYLLSPSTVESFGFTIAEAMAKGIKPLIRQRAGAIWHETWRTVDDVKTLLSGPYESEDYRECIQQRYSVETQMAAIESLLAYVREDARRPEPIIPRTNVLDARVELVEHV